jgi:hypothetical protein
MGALADFAAYAAALVAPRARIPYGKPNVFAGGPWVDLWQIAPPTGVTPTTAVALNASTAGAMVGVPATSTAQLWLAQVEAMGNFSTTQGGGVMIICDRLGHQAGLSGTVTSAQTTNLPTAALTRYTSGVGVMAAITVWTQLGATPTTATVSYTNQAGTAGRTSPAVSLPASASARRMFVVPLAAGDTGIRSVESVTLAGSTGTAGNFGITLFKALMSIPIIMEPRVQISDAILEHGGNLAEVIPDAHLFMIGVGGIASGTGFQFFSCLTLIEA